MPAADAVSRLLDRQWLLPRPDTRLDTIRPDGASGRGFRLIRDDLLHPVAGGNKLRKLDALLPALLAAGTTDVITCGGLQSAHTAAVAQLCAERGLRTHLLVRGERPAVPTGLHLYARMLGHVTYIGRREYADREAMFDAHLRRVRAEAPRGAKVAAIREGASDAAALLGIIRLAEFLTRPEQLGTDRPCRLFVDSGTGVTATGLALAAFLLRAPWTVTGIMLAGTPAYYQQHAATLLAAFQQHYGAVASEAGAARPAATDHRALRETRSAEDLCCQMPLQWTERSMPRPFGKVLPGELARCADAARRHGILLDPIWTLASWTAAADAAVGGDIDVVVLMTGGGLGLHGIAQRWPGEC